MDDFEKALHTIKESIRRTGRNKKIEDRPCFKGLSYRMKCQVSDHLAMEALKRRHKGFNQMKRSSSRRGGTVDSGLVGLPR